MPWTLESYWLFNYLRGKESPHHGRWDLLRDWLEELDEAAGSRRPTQPQQILFFDIPPYWDDLPLAMAVVLAGYDCVVDFAWLPFNGAGPYESTLSRRYARWSDFLSTPPEHPRLRIQNLLHVRGKRPTAAMIAEAEEQSKVDTQYVTRKEEIYIEANPFDRDTYNFRLSRNLRCMASLAFLLSERSYDLMVVQNGAILEFGAAYRLAKMSHLACISFEFAEFRDSVIVSNTTPSVDMDTSTAWQSDEPHIISAERQQRISRLLMSRESGDWNEYRTAYQSAPKLSPQKALKELNMRGDRPIALMCTNIAWDSAVLGRNTIFSSMVEWIRCTLDYFAEHPCWQLVVRIHPAETIFGTNQPVDKIARERLQEIPDNICLVPSDDSLNTYGLMDLSDIGLVYTSTAGLEMAARGIPVIVAAKTHYAGKGFSVDPVTVDSYYSTLDEAMNEPTTLKMTPRQIELAQCYLDVYFNDWAWPFPWHPATFEGDISEWSISKILSEEGQRKFGQSFRLLSAPIRGR